MSGSFESVLQQLRDRFTHYLSTLPPSSAPPGLLAASDYVLSNGGKHVRPTLVYLAGQAVAREIDLSVLDAPAASLELIHIYSLIHDDLPAMDNDDLRRGKPTLHRAYDEATAILVGDGLQAKAFELLACAQGLAAAQKTSMIEALARAAGPEGMVGGQYTDIQATDTDMSLEALRDMHSMKTGALIRAALALGGIAAGASVKQRQALDDYGRHVGLAFQVVDDILDVESDTATLGKTQGKDGEANKPTYVKLLGLEGAKEESRRLLGEADNSLELFGEHAALLKDLASYIVERNH